MIVLFTDFGADDLYVGQVHAVLASQAPGITVIDLLHSAPEFDIKLSSYLLAAYVSNIPVNAVVMAVVDPGVGGARNAVVMQTSKRWYVGPDNGLLTMVARREGVKAVWQIDQEVKASDSFHGRDIFAPVTARIARGGKLPIDRTINLTESGDDWPDDLYQVIYADHYGNLITGITTSGLSEEEVLLVNDQEISYARVFSEVGENEIFWYLNSNNLVEIAANKASAARLLGTAVGEMVARKQASRVD